MTLDDVNFLRDLGVRIRERRVSRGLTRRRPLRRLLTTRLRRPAFEIGSQGGVLGETPAEWPVEASPREPPSGLRVLGSPPIARSQARSMR